MSLLTDPDDYAIACKRYADSVVSILRGGRLVVAENGHASDETGRVVDTFGSGDVAKHRHFAKWLVHTIALSLSTLLPAPCLKQEKPRLGLPSLSPGISLAQETNYSGLFQTVSTAEV